MEKQDMALAYLRLKLPSFLGYDRDAPANSHASTVEQVRGIVAVHGRLTVPVERLGNEDNLFAAGLRSFAAVQIVIAIEDMFEIELDIREKEILETVGSIARCVDRIKCKIAASL